MRSLNEMLWERMQAGRGSTGFLWLENGEAEGPSLTVPSLGVRARAIAGLLQQRLKPRDRVLLAYRPGLEFVSGLFGCLLSGIIPVPVLTPKNRRDSGRLVAILADSRPSAALTTTDLSASLQRILPVDLPLIATGEADLTAADAWRDPLVRADAVAYLQYTSGSTSTPRGVMVTHANVLENLGYICGGGAVDSACRTASWLPHFHDMGLIYGIMMPLYAGIPAVLFSPGAFIQRPLRWLQAISRYGVTHTGGPNFAYDYCSDRIGEEAAAELDLSGWRVAFNGSEPIRAATMKRFAARFRRSGFTPEKFYPVYGLAEATLKVTSARPLALATLLEVAPDALERGEVQPAAGEPSQTVVGCGAPENGHVVLIVNPATLQRCPAREVGEIWVAGPSVAAGYWDRPAETAQTFQARLPDGEGSYLRTGDLGFLYGGELFVTGRLKECIIIRGRNLYPQDIEATLQLCGGALTFHAGAAFSIDDGTAEQLVVVNELEPRFKGSAEPLLAGIRRAIAEQHEVHAHAVVLVKAGGVPKTSSGKIMRRACRDLYLQGLLEVVASDVTPEGRGAIPVTDWSRVHAAAGPDRRSELVQQLRNAISALTGVSPEDVAANQPVSSLGLDSMSSLQLAHQIEESLQATVGASAILGAESLEALANAVDVSSAAAPSATSGSVLETLASENQHAIWIADRLAPEDCVFNIARAVTLRGVVDPAAWERALREVVAHHPALRATFRESEGRLLQRVREDLPLGWASAGSSSWTEAGLDEELAREANRPFDLATGPLLRARLYVGEGDGAVLLLVAHHIVVDFWSFCVLAGQLASLVSTPDGSNLLKSYAGASEPPVAAGEMDRMLAFWRGVLAEPWGRLELAPHAGEVNKRSRRAATLPIEIADSALAKLKEIARRHNTTLYGVTLALIEVLLHHHGAQRRFLLGTPWHGRDRAATQQAIGYFVNPLIVPADVSGNPSFSGLVKRVRDGLGQVFAHAALPYARVLGLWQQRPESGGAAPFQAMYVFQQGHAPEFQALAGIASRSPGACAQFGNIMMRGRELERNHTQFELTFLLSESELGLGGVLEYDADLLDAERARRIAGDFVRLAGLFGSDPDRRIGAIDFESKPAGVRIAPDGGVALAALFERRVLESPRAAAVLFGGESLDYRELNARANALAHRLLGAGIGKEQRVGVCLPRGTDMMAAIWGVLKTGAALTPLDPSNPPARLAEIGKSANLAAIVTLTPLLPRLPPARCPVILLDGAWHREFSEPRSNPLTRIETGNLACVMYTSGSTGGPKGVAVTHGAIVNLFGALRATVYGGRPLEGLRMGMNAPLAFDSSVKQWVMALGGAVLVPIPDDARADGGALLAFIGEMRLDALDVTPAHAAALRNAGLNQARPLTLLVGGEAISGGLWKDLGASVTLNAFNVYGPTECTVDATCAKIAGDLPVIGSGLPNVRVYVANEYMRLVPPGVPGELFVGGAGLARGYLGRPDLTAERFVPDPFSGRSGVRLYQTGDRVRSRATGDLEFLGRMDWQVKVRGYRIEVEEIERVLVDGHDITQAMVKVEGEDDARRLVAYVVAGEAVDFDAAGRRASQRLPAYMLPARFVPVENLPLNSNGKIDRSAALIPVRPAVLPARSAPVGPIEEELLRLWEELLGQSAGATDSFFALGGHSLLLTRMASRIEAAFHVRLPLSVLHDQPTVAGIARALEAEYLKRTESEDMRRLVDEVKSLSDRELRTQLLQSRTLREAPFDSGLETTLKSR